MFEWLTKPKVQFTVFDNLMETICVIGVFVLIGVFVNIVLKMKDREGK